jgi:hypothetical protein
MQHNISVYTFLRFYFEFSGVKRVEPSVDIANTVLVRNMRFTAENLTQKSLAGWIINACTTFPPSCSIAAQTAPSNLSKPLQEPSWLSQSIEGFLLHYFHAAHKEGTESFEWNASGAAQIL